LSLLHLAIYRTVNTRRGKEKKGAAGIRFSNRALKREKERERGKKKGKKRGKEPICSPAL